MKMKTAGKRERSSLDSNCKSQTQPPCKKTRSCNDCDQASAKNSSSSKWQNPPYEILYKIFKHYMDSYEGDPYRLMFVRNVCKFWGRVAEDGRLLESFDLSTYFKRYNYTISRLKNLIKDHQAQGQNECYENKFRFVKRLNLDNLPLKSKEFEQLMSLCGGGRSHLTELNISRCVNLNQTVNDFDKNMATIAVNCPNLRKLSMSKMNKAIGPNSLAPIFEKVGANLITIDLSQNTLAPSILADIAVNCKNIEKVDISNCHFTGKGSIKLTFDELIYKSFHLRELNMLNTYPKTRYSNIETVIKSEPCLLEMETLGIKFDEQLCGIDQLIWLFAKLVRDSEELRILDTRYYRSPLDPNLNIFSMIKSNKLTRLYLCHSNLSEADNYYLMNEIRNRWYKTLVELDLSNSNIRIETLKRIFQAFAANPAESKLKYINLTGTCINLDTIRDAITRMPALQYLNLTSCRSVHRGLKREISVEDFLRMSTDSSLDEV